jgi:hypothetical protein
MIAVEIAVAPYRKHIISYYQAYSPMYIVVNFHTRLTYLNSMLLNTVSYVFGPHTIHMHVTIANIPRRQLIFCW